MPQIDREGTCLGVPCSWGWREIPNWGEGPEVEFIVHEIYDEESKTFQPAPVGSTTCKGMNFLYDKDGKEDEKGMARFKRVFGWTGDPEQDIPRMKEHPPEIKCKFGVKKRTGKKGEVYYQINWFGLPGDTGGECASADELDGIAARLSAKKKGLPPPAAKVAPSPFTSAPTAPMPTAPDPFAKQETPF